MGEKDRYLIVVSVLEGIDVQKNLKFCFFHNQISKSFAWNCFVDKSQKVTDASGPIGIAFNPPDPLYFCGLIKSSDVYCIAFSFVEYVTSKAL